MDTNYVVLRRDPDAVNPQVWRVVAESVEAHSADAASRTVAIGADTEGVYVAVPARSWNPTEQQKETTTVWRAVKA